MRQYSVGNTLAANVKTTVYTVPTGYYALWKLCYVVNTTGNNKTVNVWWYDKSTTTEVVVVGTYSIAHTDFLRFDGGAYVVLEEGDEIRLQSELGSTMNAINTFEVIRKA